jgi:hypothetical protein
MGITSDGELMSNILVFLGPTLAINEARQILPKAWYHAPVEGGDILRVLRLKPDCIVIIDGYYEQRASVWHKEILYALEIGIPVIGAASMGALRAAEMQYYGMIGVGKIYEDYFHGILTGDDEVAVLHQTGAGDYIPLNEALVNIRATIQQAVQEKIITDKQGQSIIHAAKSMHYSERSIVKACQLLPDDFSVLFEWLKSGKHINQKKLDTLAALHFVHQHFHMKPVTREAMEKTIYIRKLLIDVNTSTFNESYDFLPQHEKDLIHLKKQNPNVFRLVSELAELLSITYELGSSKVLQQPVKLEDLNIKKSLDHYQKDTALTIIYWWVADILNQKNQDIHRLLEKYQRWTNLIFCRDEAESDFLSRFVEQYALLWFCLDEVTKMLRLTISVDDIQKKTSLFMEANHIYYVEELTEFINNKISMEEFNEMLMSLAYLQIVFKARNFDFLLTDKNVSVINWLQKAYQSIL